MTTKAAPDLSAFFKLSRPKRKPCPVGFALAQLDDTSRAQLKAALDEGGTLITTTAIQQWLKLTGRDFDANCAAISAHRRGVCTCGDS